MQSRPPPSHSTQAGLWSLSERHVAAPRRDLARSVFLGLIAILVAVGGLVAWSIAAPLASAIIVSGKIIVATKRKEIQHVDGGIVGVIRVRDGDRVTEGDVLVELDDTKAKTRFLLTKAAFYNSAASYARLIAERDGADRIVFPEFVVEEAQRNREISQAMETQRQLFQSRREEIAGQIQITRQKIAQLKDEIEGLAAERSATAKQSELAATEADITQDLFARGYATRVRLHAIRREAVQLAGSIGRLDASMAKARKEIGEAELAMQQLMLKRQTDVAAEIKDIEQRIYDLKEGHAAAQAEMRRLRIAAPVSGTIVNSKLNTIGGVIQPGQTILEIVPGADALIVEARLRPSDIDAVSVGQEAEIRLSGASYRALPPLSGTVIHVAADALSDQRTGEGYYTALVQLSRSRIERLDLRLQPGMPAEVLIKTGARTAMSYLVQPLVENMQRAMRER